MVLINVRFFVRHPWQLVLAVLGVALGVAVVVSIDLTKVSAERAFELSTESVLGKATHRIIGGPSGLDQSIYRELKLQGNAWPSAPIIEGTVRTGPPTSTRLQVVGVDPFSELQFRHLWWTASHTDHEPAAPRLDLNRFLSKPTAVISAATAQRLQLHVDSLIPLQTDGQSKTVTLLGIVTPDNPTDQAASEDLLVVDIATAQELLGLGNRITRIDLILPTGPNEQSAEQSIRQLLPADATLVPAGARSRAMQQMTKAFHQHLQALSLLALVVGTFIVYNTLSFIVVQRRQLLGTLRALGLKRNELFLLVLGEAAVLGLVGTVLGCVLGILLGKLLLGMVTGTINDIYYTLPLHQLTISSWSLLKGAVLGTTGSLIAALIPAFEAARSAPRLAMIRSEMETQIQRALLSLTAAGGFSLLSAYGLLFVSLPNQSIGLAFLILTAVMVGAALLTPAATWLLAGLARWPLKLAFGLMGSYAARNVRAALSRTAVAVATLMLAVATTIGIGLMITSFRDAVNTWLIALLRADFYVMRTAQPAASDGPISESMRNVLAAVPGVTHISTARHITLEDKEGLTHITAYGMAPESYAGFQFLEGDPSTVWPAFEGGRSVILSEPYAYRKQLHVGQSVRLRTDVGEHEFRIAGVYRDYSTEHGVVAMSRQTFERYWHDQGYNSLGLYTEPLVGSTDLTRILNELSATGPPLTLTSNRELRMTSLAIFDRTFAITGILRLLAGGIAFVGVFSALMALQFERTRELGVLRACGLTPVQIAKTIVIETTLLGSIAGLLAVPVGSAMAGLLVFVINKQSFGWSMPLAIDMGTLLAGFALAPGAAWLAGAYPAWRMSCTTPAMALRDE